MLLLTWCAAHLTRVVYVFTVTCQEVPYPPTAVQNSIKAIKNRKLWREAIWSSWIGLIMFYLAILLHKQQIYAKRFSHIYNVVCSRAALMPNWYCSWLQNAYNDWLIHTWVTFHYIHSGVRTFMSAPTFLKCVPAIEVKYFPWYGWMPQFQHLTCICIFFLFSPLYDFIFHFTE